MQASASNSSGDTQCPVNFSEAADGVLSGLQGGFLWPMLVVEFLVALAGNSLALYRFCSREQHPWPPAMIFSAQLAVSDLLYALTLPPLAAYIYPPKHWRYGEAACRLERFLFTCNLLGSVIFITCISLNRYMGIVHPFFTHSQLRPKHAWAVSAAGWVLAVLLAAPTLSFSHLSESQRPDQCSVANPGACTKCLGTAGDSQLEAYRVYSLALATLGCGLPLLLTLAAYGALGRAVQHSHGMTAADKLQVTVLVASGVALYASSYVPYYITAVLNVYARLRWLALCPGFTSEAAAEKALAQRTYLAHQVTRGLVPLAICIHPLLYMAVVPSLDCCHQCCGQGQTPKSTKCSSQALPLNVTATPPNLRAPVPRAEPVTWPIFSPLLVTRCWNPAAEWRQRAGPRPRAPTQARSPYFLPTERPPVGLGGTHARAAGASTHSTNPGEGHGANPRLGGLGGRGGGGAGGGAGPTHNSVIDIRE